MQRPSMPILFGKIHVHRKVFFMMKALSLLLLISPQVFAFSTSNEITTYFKLIDTNASEFYSKSRERKIRKPLATSKQYKNITGVVINEAGERLVGASINVKGSNRGVVSDSNGSFTIEAADNDILVISSVGYNAKEVLVGGQNDLGVIVLTKTANTMDEIVVVAFGTKQKSTLIQSVAQVDEKLVKNRPVNNAISALQGQVAGLNITSYSGQPGIAPSFNIRGAGSVRSSTTPIVIIDGMPGSISLIDPNDIESISVLKDASAASLYGARSANGVILITTKKGNVGKISVSYSGYVGWQKPTELFKEASAYNYANAFNLATMYDVITPADTRFDSSRRVFTDAQLDGWKSGNVASTDWRKSLFTGNNGFTQSHFVNVGGGLTHEALTLRSNLSFGFLQLNGNVANTDYKRYSIRSNSELKWNHLTTALSIGYISDDRNEPSSRGVGNFTAIVSAINRQRPVDSIKLHDGSWNITSTNDTRNPIRQAEEGGYNNPRNNNFLMNFNIAYMLVKDLTLKYTNALSYNFNSADQFQNQLLWYNGTITGPNVSAMSNSLARENMNQLDLSYLKNINKHHFEAIVGLQQNVYNYKSTSLSRSNFINNNSNSMQLGDPSTQTNFSSQYKWILQGLFGRIDYDFDKKYMVELNFREDASSRLTPGHNTDFFPSFAVGWRLSQEPFWESIKVALPEFKVRASYGTLGNANVAGVNTDDNNGMYYSYNSIFGNVKANDLGYNYASVFDGTIYNAFTQIQNPNNTLRWERTTITDIGIDGSIGSSRFTYTVDYFNKATKNMLLQYPISNVNGVTSIVGVNQISTYPRNLGNMYNRGIEVALGYLKQNSNGFGYSFNGTYSYITSKITDLGGLNLESTNTIAVGYPLSSFFLYTNDGFLTKDEFINKKSVDPILAGQKWGDQRIKDINGDNTITALDRQMINKTGVAKHQVGFNFDINYKGFGIAGMLQGAAGYYKNLGASVGYGFNSGYSITNWTIANAYDPSNPDNYDTRLPRTSISNTINNTYPSTLFLFNSSYVRLKNFQIYYDLPGSVLQRMHMKNMRIYGSGQNLLTWSKLPKTLGIDPEINSVTSGYPLVSIYSFGLNVSF